MRYILKNARLLPFLCGAGAPAYADIIIDEDNKGIEETLELLKEKFC